MTKPNPKNLDPKIRKVFDESEVGALITHFENSLIGIASNQIAMGEKIDSIDNRMGNLENRMDSLDNRMDSLGDRMDSLENEFVSFKSQTEANFKSLLQAIIHLESQVEEIFKILNSKAGKSDLTALEHRVSALESDLHLCKSQLALLKKS